MIYITMEVQQQIKAESERCYPDECCGILFGKLEDFSEEIEGEGWKRTSVPQDKSSCRKEMFIKRVEGIQPITNSFEDNEKYHRFLITPETMMKAELEARRRKQDIVGFYHSHPNKPAFPSEYDREHALPIYSYIITSVVFGIVVETNCFELSVKEETSIFYPEDIRVEEKIEVTN